MIIATILSVVFLGALSSASPLETNACAQISSIYTAQKSSSPGAIVRVPGQLAYDCLNSVPIRKADASALINSILPYVEWQSDLEWLKKPPEGYLEAAIDIRVELDGILHNIESYKSEYAFQADIFRIFHQVHDGHFRFNGDLLTRTLNFQRQISVVSVSLDGKTLPQIYAKSDIDAYTNDSQPPSPFKSINGVDAITFLEDWAQLGVLQDPDALWNTASFSKPFAAQNPTWQGYFAGSGFFGFIWPGPSTEIEYQNGTKITYPTLSTVLGNFTGITSGEDVYTRFCTPSSTRPLPPTAPTPPESQVPGYPDPVIVSSDGVISGYYLTDQPDVAVVAMLSFEPNSPAEFQYVLERFLDQATKDGKKKLVIDVAANGGGLIFSGYDTFRQLFPHVVQDGNNRFRYNPGTKAIVDQYNKVLKDQTIETIVNANDTLINMWESPFNYKFDFNTTNQHFQSVEDKSGPYTYEFGSGSDQATNYLRWDLSDPLLTSNTTYGFGTDITGYRSRANNFTQPFPAEDIILLYDGYCASTCTLFSDFMKNQAGVKSVVFGGRPSRDPQQGIGGTKGANNFGFDGVRAYAGLALQTASPEEQNTTLSALQQYSRLPLQRSTLTSINFRDAIRTADLESGIPAQFLYEAADCRLFYEPAMIKDVSAIWTAAAEATWGDKQCIQGGFPQHYKRVVTESAIRDAVPQRRIAVPTFPVLPPHPLDPGVRGQKVAI